MVTEANTSASGVLAPAFSLTEDCDRPPATGKPCQRPAARFAAPSPSSSCRGVDRLAVRQGERARRRTLST